jgi:hypothetical protein
MAHSIRIKDGLIQRLRETRGFPSEDAFARFVGCDRITLRRIQDGSQPSGAFMASFCTAFGMGLGEAFDIVDVQRVTAPKPKLAVAV